MQTAYGLPEFDSLSYDTEILLKALKAYPGKEVGRALALNPGQGHVPAALFKLLRPQTVTLADRDLLALRYARRNLISNGCSAGSISLYHTAGLEVGNERDFDLVAGVLRDENKAALQYTLGRAAGLLAGGGLIILSGGSTPVTRLESYVGESGLLKVRSRERWRGYSVLTLQKM
jgi:hypothetical protein